MWWGLSQSMLVLVHGYRLLLSTYDIHTSSVPCTTTHHLRNLVCYAGVRTRVRFYSALGSCTALSIYSVLLSLAVHEYLCYLPHTRDSRKTYRCRRLLCCTLFGLSYL